MWALVLDGSVAELIPDTVTVDGRDVPIAERYDPDFVGALIAAGPEVEIGWIWDGAVFAPPATPEPAPIVLPPLTARQLRLWLLGQGITRAMVEAKLAELPEPEREAAEIEWEYSTQYLRDHPLIVQIGAAFGLSAADIDAAWPEAAAL